MVKYIETTGRSEEDAIAAALFQLGLERDDVSIEIIERAKTGFIGLGKRPARVRVGYEVDSEGGKPRPLHSFQEEILSSVLGDAGRKETPQAKAPEAKPAPREQAAPAEKPEPAPVRKPEPAPAPKPPKPAPASVKPPAQEPPPAAPKQEPEPEEEEETILAAKPGWEPARPARQPRPQNQSQGRRDSRPRDGGRRKGRGSLQNGDEVLMGEEIPPMPEQTGPVERPPHHEPVLSPVSEDDEKANRIRDFLTGLMEHLEVEAEPEIMITDEGNYKVRLVGENLGSIIGRRGETLDAIQQLTSYAVNHGQSKRVRIHVDAEGYRAKREESLQRLAVKMAGKVVKARRSMMLEPMNAYERHVIHTALQDYPGVTTYSTGVEPNRRTVVAYAPDVQK